MLHLLIMDPLSVSQCRELPNKHWYLCVRSPLQTSSLWCCGVFAAVQLFKQQKQEGKWEASVEVVAGDRCQKGFHTGAGESWHAILHKKKVIGLLIALRGMFQWPSQFVGLPSASVSTSPVSVLCDLTWTPSSFHGVFHYCHPVCLQRCLHPSGGTLLFSSQSVNC